MVAGISDVETCGLRNAHHPESCRATPQWFPNVREVGLRRSVEGDWRQLDVVSKELDMGGL